MRLLPVLVNILATIDRLIIISAVAVAFGGAVAFSLVLDDHASANTIRENLTVIIGTSSTLLGFLISSGALIFAVGQTPLIRNLYRTGHMQRLLTNLHFAGICFFGATCSGFFAMYKPSLSTAFGIVLPNQYVVSVAMMLFATGLFLLVPACQTLYSILLSQAPPDTKLEID